MKRVLLGLVLGVAVGAVVAWSFLQHREPEKKEARKEEHKEESHVQHGTNGETFLKFDAHAQERMNLKVAALEPATLPPELKIFGHVLDAAPLATALNEISVAAAQLESSVREQDRLKVLFGQNQNVSARAVEVAEAAVKRERLALEAARTRLVSSWGPAVGEMKGLDALVGSALAQKAALVRLDVPVGEKLKGAPVGARIALLSAPDHPIAAKLLGRAVGADPQSLSQGFLFVVEGAFQANAAVLGWLDLAGENEQGAIIPRDALVRHEGEAFVYVQTGAETFARKEVDLDYPLDSGWFSDELKPGTKVVVTGAQQLLSEEFKGESEGE